MKIVVRFVCLSFPATFTCPISGAATNLDEVVVTATRTPQFSFDVAAAVNAEDPRQNASLGISLGEYLRPLAGVLSRDRENYAQDQQLSIRGFGARAQFGIIGVRLYVDGIPATMPDGQGQATHFNFDSASRIEVLRGPISALYGNASGGVVQLFTESGSKNEELRIYNQAGSANTWRFSLNARGTAAGVAYNFDYTRFRTDGWRDHSAAHRDSGNIRLDFSPSDSNQLMLVANRLSAPNAQDNGSLTLAQFSADPRQAAPTALQFNTRKSVAQTQVGLNDKQQLDDQQELQLTAYSGTRQVTQVLATPVAAQASPLSPGGVVALKGRYYGVDARWTFNGEVLRRKLSVVAGLSYDLLDSDRRGYTNFNGTTLGVVGALRRDESNQLYDADQYLQADWFVSSRWSASLGIRHSYVHFNSKDHFINGSNPDDSGSIAFAAWTPVMSALYRATDHLNWYAAYGRAFDTPTFDNLAYRLDGDSGLNFNLRAARTHNLELGSKWRSDAAAARWTVFRSDTQDEIGVASAQGGRSTYRNVGRTRRQGFESELNVALYRQWHLQLAYTLLDATYLNRFETCVTSSCLPGTGIVIPSGNRIPAIPRSNAFVQLAWGAAEGWNAALEASYLSRIAVDDANSQFADAYGTLGVNGAYVRNSQQWQTKILLRMENVFDRGYAGAIVVNDANGRFYQPGTGREIYAGLAVKWRQQ